MEQKNTISPVVSVVCLCYNHARFVQEAIESVLNQTFDNIELIVVDDASTDASAQIINQFQNYEQVRVHINKENLGNCKAFNLGFKMSKGAFLIDLAADDLLTPERVLIGVNELQKSKAGVHFSNMELINEAGDFVRHYHKVPLEIPQGNVYEEVLARHFIGGASMMIRREVLERLNGYDEDLAYEDFDFWVRSSREFEYVYSPEVLVQKRLVRGSKGDKQLKFNSNQLRSTYRVCEKAFNLNRSTNEHKALKKRIRYEMRKAIETGNIRLANDYMRLSRKVQAAILASS